MKRPVLIMLSILSMISIFRISAQPPVLTGSNIQRIDGEFQFLEGPAWKDGFIYFSDIPANKVYRWSEESGLETYLEDSGHSNGLLFDHDGILLLAQHGQRRVAVRFDDGEEFGLIEEYQGKRLNSPNDLTIRSDGAIYFTDPPYGIQPGQSETGFSGIYLWTREDVTILLDKSFSRPNGIALSPDEDFLYVNDSPSRKIYRWELDGDGLKNKKLFATLDAEGGNADGMKTDSSGFLYSAGPGGIWIFDPNGKLVRRIEIPGQVTNCGWGGENRDELFVTTANALYRVKNDN